MLGRQDRADNPEHGLLTPGHWRARTQLVPLLLGMGFSRNNGSVGRRSGAETKLERVTSFLRQVMRRIGGAKVDDPPKCLRSLPTCCDAGVLPAVAAAHHLAWEVEWPTNPGSDCDCEAGLRKAAPVKEAKSGSSLLGEKKSKHFGHSRVY